MAGAGQTGALGNIAVVADHIKDTTTASVIQMTTPGALSSAIAPV